MYKRQRSNWKQPIIGRSIDALAADLQLTKVDFKDANENTQRSQTIKIDFTPQQRMVRMRKVKMRKFLEPATTSNQICFDVPVNQSLATGLTAATPSADYLDQSIFSLPP